VRERHGIDRGVDRRRRGVAVADLHLYDQRVQAVLDHAQLAAVERETLEHVGRAMAAL
jgi:hypothetical protein